MRDRLAVGSQKFEWLDAVQLVKHALGLVTEAARRRKAPVLVYLYAEPDAWPGGKPIAADDRTDHAREAQRFAREVEGAEVIFRICSYRQLLRALRESSNPELIRHANNVEHGFQP